MKNMNRNTIVIAEKSRDNSGFIIFLDHSGRREQIMFHKRNNPLYKLLKDGIPLSEMRKLNAGKWMVKRSTSAKARGNGSEQFACMVRHLLRTVDDYCAEAEIVA